MQVFAMSVVCEAVASQRGEFLYTSVVANFTASNRPSEDFVIGQFEFACQTNSWGTSLFNAPSLIIPSDATLDTPSRSDCRLCGRTSDPSSLLAPLIDAGISAGNYDNVTHCLRKWLHSHNNIYLSSTHSYTHTIASCHCFVAVIMHNYFLLPCSLRWVYWT